MRVASFQGHAGRCQKSKDGISIRLVFLIGTDVFKVFLERSGARVINSESLRPPNPKCPVCGVMHSRLEVDPSRATLNDLVQTLQSDLGYSEFSINNEVGTLYDPDLEDNLSKKFSDLGVRDDSFLTIVDDDEDNPRVDLSLSVSQKSLPESEKPVLLPSGFEVPRKPTIDAEQIQQKVNGTITPPTSQGKRKRELSLEEPGIDGQLPTKRGKVQNGSQDDELIIVEDSSNGAIVIDD